LLMAAFARPAFEIIAAPLLRVNVALRRRASA